MRLYPVLIVFIFQQSILADIEPTKRELRDLSDKIREEKQVINTYERKESNLLDQLDEIENDFVERRIKIDTLRQQIVEVSTNLARMKTEVAEIKTELKEYFGSMRGKIVQLYKIQRNNTFNSIFSYRTYNDFIRNDKIIERIITEDMEYIGYYNGKISEYGERMRKLEEQEKKLSVMKKEEQEHELTIGKLKEEKTSFLGRVQDEKKQHQRILNELEASSARLSAMISTFQHRGDGESSRRGNLAKLKGLLAPPLDQHMVAEKFGRIVDPQYKTEVFQKGIDFIAPMNADVKAIFQGRVIFARWFQGYGNLIILDHGFGYFSLYAHLARMLVSEQAEVDLGTVIGLLGDTGSLKGPLLYFELRRFGKNLDPLHWFDQEKIVISKDVR